MDNGHSLVLPNVMSCVASDQNIRVTMNIAHLESGFDSQHYLIANAACEVWEVKLMVNF